MLEHLITLIKKDIEDIKVKEQRKKEDMERKRKSEREKINLWKTVIRNELKYIENDFEVKESDGGYFSVALNRLILSVQPKICDYQVVVNYDMGTDRTVYGPQIVIEVYKPKGEKEFFKYDDIDKALKKISDSIREYVVREKVCSKI